MNRVTVCLISCVSNASKPGRFDLAVRHIGILGLSNANDVKGVLSECIPSCCSSTTPLDTTLIFEHQGEREVFESKNQDTLELLRSNGDPDEFNIVEMNSRDPVAFFHSLMDEFDASVGVCGRAPLPLRMGGGAYDFHVRCSCHLTLSFRALFLRQLVFWS